ncbi:hypothetical protein [Paenibacillus faecis]|uniref:hypothetical protein n=1 Tax=Paenibacillus faecis TaxID=862114 RepID=UPI0014797228|nr:hypothetical protein [Paenibacillus faecis]
MAGIDLDRFSQPLWGEQERRTRREDELAEYKRERDERLEDDLEGGEEDDGN